jgi:hypothetical protein
MRAVLLAAVSTLVVGLSGAAVAQPTAMPVATNVDDANKLICRRVEHQGTLMAVVECHNRAGWDIRLRRAQMQFADFQRAEEENRLRGR